MTKLPFIASLFLIGLATSNCQAQERALSFPEDFLGIYKGLLSIDQPDKPQQQQIEMEFHLLPTDTSNRFHYRPIYNEVPRNYTLIIDDEQKGEMTLDENNGIMLPLRLKENVLHSFFEVERKLLTSRLEFHEDHVKFEILFTDLQNKVRTGENTDYEIYGYPITTTQKATLIKQSQ